MYSIGILNNTNSIQIKTIRALPIIKPDEKIKEKVENIVKKIIKEKQIDKNYDYGEDQKKIDKLIYNYHNMKFNFKEPLRNKLKENYSIY